MKKGFQLLKVGSLFYIAKNNYLYNGIEHCDDFGLELDMAFFRSYDPAIGRWNQVDPKHTYSQSVYSGMGNNPILYSDFLGDTTRVYGMDGISMGTIDDGFENQEHFIRDSDRNLAQYTIDQYNSGDLSATGAGLYIRAGSSDFIGKNTRADIERLSSESGDLELPFVLTNKPNDGTNELVAEAVKAEFRETNKTAISFSTAESLKRRGNEIVGFGHTHTKAGLIKLRNFGADLSFTAKGYGTPSSGSKTLSDYKNVIYGKAQDSASVQFIGSPKGYTIYSSTRKTPEGSSHKYPQQIVNHGNVFNYKGKLVHTY